AFQQFESGETVLIPEYTDLLDALSGAAQRAKQKSMRMPKGAGGNPAFDRFIEDLLMAARMLGGDWTNYRARDGVWKGTLREAVGILEKFFPEGFFTPGEPGRSVEHIRKKFKNHIKKAPARRLMPQGSGALVNPRLSRPPTTAGTPTICGTKTSNLQ